MTLLARLKPFSERKGYLTRIYSIDGYRFYAERGWYEVSDALGEKLKELHQQHYDEESPYLFDVATEEDATKIDEKESEAVAAAKATARAPQKLRNRATQVWPVNNAGGIDGLPETGDLTTLDINAGKVLDTPPVVSDDESSETSDIGRVKQPKVREKK